jgi:hypothetical protein
VQCIVTLYCKEREKAAAEIVAARRALLAPFPPVAERFQSIN